MSSMIIIENRIVKGIRGNLFDIDHVSIPEGVIGIFSNTFDGCSCLTSITFPTTLELIGDYCFRDCHNLTSVTLPDNVYFVGQWAFCRCSNLTSITLPKHVTKVEDGTFQECSRISSVTMSDDVTDIGHSAFRDCRRLRFITIPKKLKSIGDNAFRNNLCLRCIRLPETMYRFGDNVFTECLSLRSVSLSEGLYYKFGQNVFSPGCMSLLSITLRPSVSWGAFIVWSVGNSRHRDNWELTTVKRLRNVLRLILTFVNSTRDVDVLFYESDSDSDSDDAYMICRYDHSRGFMGFRDWGMGGVPKSHKPP